MTLPDFSAQIFTYFNAVLAWSPITVFLGVSMAMALLGVVVAVLMRGLMRG